MNKIQIDCAKLTSPLKELNAIFAWQAPSIEAFFEILKDKEDVMIIELKNDDIEDRNLGWIIDMFENVQQKNANVYIIRGIK